MNDLDKLIEAMEAGDYGDMVGTLRRMASAAHDTGKPWHGHDIEKAFSGSLDAALRLHKALLPGWRWEAGTNLGGKPIAQVWDVGSPTQGVSEPPARAWLLAILRALKAQGERE